MKPGCKEEYESDVTVDAKAPFGIFAQQNYPSGWIDPVCLMCSNQDETKTINISIDQLSCVESKNCPAGNGTAPVVAKPGQCKNHLKVVQNPTKIVIPFDDISNDQQYTRVNSLQFFTNDDP